MKNVPWTSIEAFLKVLPKLGGQRLMVLKWLIEYSTLYSFFPTATELADWAERTKPEGKWKENLQRVRRRLQELRDLVNAVHDVDPRECTVSKNMELVWVPGPAPNHTIGNPRTNAKIKDLTERFQLLRAHAPHLVDVRVIARILKCTEKQATDAVTNMFN